MPAPARKRARKATPPPDPEPGPPSAAAEAPASASASHLVSFLTAYAERADESGSDGEGSGSASEGEHDEHDDVEDDDDDDPRTPSKKVGLVGTPSRRKGKTPGSSATTPRKPRTPGTARNAKPLPGPGEEGYVRASRADAYFLAAGRGTRTSGQSYAALATPLSQAEYEATANGARGTTRQVKDALQAAEGYFPQWEAELDAGFNLLLYGYGSKRRLVNRFTTALARRGHVAVVNGYFPGLGLRDVLASLEDNLAIPDAPAPPGAAPLERAAHRLFAHFSSEGVRPLFLVLHNIDAPALKAAKALAVLALLACAPGIHIVATFDHVNTPLLFSATASATPPHPWRKPRSRRKGDEYVPADVPPTRGFNWVYHSVATYDDYDVELSYARLSASAIGALGHSGAAGVSEEGALQILRSVPPMAARLLKLILSRQIASLPPDPSTHAAHPPSQTAPAFAMDVDLIQKTARDRFIAREEDRFNALLGEFRDHGLVVVAELDGEGRTGRWAWVPLGKSAIERILDEMKDVEV